MKSVSDKTLDLLHAAGLVPRGMEHLLVPVVANAAVNPIPRTK